jgi:hypothetical protein
VAYTGVTAGLAAAAHKYGCAAILDSFIFSFDDRFTDTSTTPEHGHLFDHIPDFQAQVLRQLRDDDFASRGAPGGLHFARQETDGETGTTGVTARTAVQAGQDPLYVFQTGVNVNVEFLRCDTQAESGDQPESCETDDCCNHISISPFRKSP